MAVVFGAAQATTSVDEKALVRNRKKTNRASLFSLEIFWRLASPSKLDRSLNTST